MPRSSAQPEARLLAIEVLLLWEGRVSRGRLLELFDVHETMASRDLAAFRQQFPDACRPLLAEKAYERTTWMGPTLSRGHFSDYLALVGASTEGQIIAGVPVEMAGADATRVNFNDFATLHSAIREGHAIVASYRSLSHPTSHRRIIRPHTLIQAGPRWHVRAWCQQSVDFRDFNLGRMSDLAISDALLPSADADDAWNTIVTLRFVPHALLDADQRTLVRNEYMDGTAALRFDVRAPMARYLIQRFRAAIHPQDQQPPDYLMMVDSPESLPAAALWHREGQR